MPSPGESAAPLCAWVLSAACLTLGACVPGGSDADAGIADERPAPSPRVHRLTHAQWENTVQDLFGLPQPTGLSASFRPDPVVAGFVFDNDASALEVDDALWSSYRIAAGEVARRVTRDPDLLGRLMPASGETSDARARDFVTSFGRRAYRRPLSEPETEALLDLFAAGPGLYTEVADPFVAGMRHVIEAALQSPHFLYRIEQSTRIVGETIPLEDHELAQRLSYFLWNSMPDDALLSAAARGELSDPDEVERHVLRMLDDPRAAGVVERFHAQLLDADGFSAPAREENARFVRDVVFGGGGGLFELLTSTRTWVNADLAAVYDIDGSYDDAFVPVRLDEDERRGVFTQVGFLSANASGGQPDPIHRGVFVARRMACLDIAAPPADIPPLPPVDETLTNRERIEAHTEVPGSVCAGCHSTKINPYGFAFEGFDAAGARRTVDAGKPVDTAARVQIGDERVDVGDALELADALAASEAVHRCYVEHWLEFATGRPVGEDDDPLLGRLADLSLAQRRSIRELLKEIATSPAFLARSVEEMP